MKKTIIAIFTLTSLLAGCSHNNETGEYVNEQIVDIGNLGGYYDLVRDINTGCVYIYERGASYSRPLTPYYGEDGEVVGCGEKDLDKSKYE